MIKRGRYCVTALLVVTAGSACEQPGPADTDDAPPVAVSSACGADRTSAALAPPPGTQPGQPYRWLSRSWRSPLGLTIRTYGLAVDGISVHGRHQVEIHDQRDRLIYRTGTAGAVLAELHTRGRSAPAASSHPLDFLARSGGGVRAHPLAHSKQRAVWHYAHGDLVPAVLTERLDLLGERPRGEITLRHAVTGAELARRRTVFEIRETEYLVYAGDDGRPLTSPLGNTLPHPTGVPDGKVPLPSTQQRRRQSGAVAARSDRWLPPYGRETRGNNVVAFFDSLLDRSGTLVDIWDEENNSTPEYGPEPDLAGGDFFATATANRFEFRYDPTRTVNEYFQDGAPGTSAPPPDPNDVAINAKIVQAFYATNWLHDFFYGAGFDEVAGNAQRSNRGRGGVDCDPLIVHAGFSDTFTFPGTDGQSPVLDLGLNRRSASRRDSSMDFTVLGHEWGHYMIGRLAGGTGDGDALANLQGLALHEGIADFVGVLVNVSRVDARGAFAVGSYDNLDYIERRPTIPATEARADAMYYGIRRYPYSLDLGKNPLTFRHLAEPPPGAIPYFSWKNRGPLLSEPHTAGEIFAAALFQCFGNIVAAHPGTDLEGLRARMAKYLVAGLIAFPDHPSLLQARNAFLDVVRLASPADDYPACRAGFAARGMGADTVGPDRNFGDPDPHLFPPYDPRDVKESFLDRDRALRLISSGLTPAATGGAGSGAFRVDLRNTGLVELPTTSVEITPEVPAAVTFPDGPRLDLGPTVPEETASISVAAVLNACLLPAHPSQAGFRALDYTVTATAPGAEGVRHQVTYHLAVPSPPTPCTILR